MSRPAWKNVSRAAPCPVCGKGDWCSQSSDGLWVICRRLDTGDGLHKVDRAGVDYWLYRVGGELTGEPPEPESYGPAKPQLASADTLEQVYRAVLDALRLDDHHRDDLRRRGLSDEAISRLGYRTLLGKGRKAIADAVKRKGHEGVLRAVPGFHIVDGQYWSFAGAPGLVIPVRDRYGRIIALKTRSDAQKTDRRYLYVSSAQYSGPGPGSPVHVPLFDGRVEVVRLTEGELKADVATSLSGILTVSIPGVSAWRKAVPVLQELKARTIRLAFDADARTNRNVARSLKHAADSLVEAGFTLELEVWNGETAKGIDDLLALGESQQVLVGDAAAGAIAEIVDDADKADPKPSAQALTDALQLAKELLEKARGDPGAPFTPDAIRALVLLEQNNRPEYVRTREALRSVKVPFRILDRAMAQERERTRQERAASESGERLAVDGAGGSQSTLPMIIVHDRDLGDITRDALDALVADNDPPTMFLRGSLLTRVRKDDRGRPYLEPMTDPALRGRMARAANWRKEDVTKDAEVEYQPVFPPDDVVEDLAALPDLPFPRLFGIVECPVFGPNGVVIDDQGYNPEANVWYAPDSSLVVPPVPESPDAEAIRLAKNLIITELLGDFPFVDAAGLAHAVGALLQPFLRLMIGGPTPLFLIDKPSPGTGASLLADAISIPATGQAAEVMAEGRDEDEVRKRLTSILLKAPVFVLFDNIRRPLDSAQLSAAITATMWSDRVLGRSAMTTLPVLSTWLGTGNNVTLSNEMARRTALIRLDAKMDRPFERRAFRHKDLRRWAREHRGDLVWAALVLGRAWLDAGRPSGELALGGFEAWSEVIGGVLKVAGIEGFLANTSSLYDRADEETREWRTFVQHWADKYGDKEVLAGELYGLAMANDLFGDVLGDKGERSQKTRFGKALRRMRDRVIGSHLIDDGGTDKSGRQVYRLREHRPTAPPDVSRTCVGSMPHVYRDDFEAKPSSANPSADMADAGRLSELPSPISSEINTAATAATCKESPCEGLAQRMPRSATSAEHNGSPDRPTGQDQVLGAYIGYTSRQRMPAVDAAAVTRAPSPPAAFDLPYHVGSEVLTPHGAGQLWQAFRDRVGVMLEGADKVAFFHPEEITVQGLMPARFDVVHDSDPGGDY